jgi:hypothetical protein
MRAGQRASAEDDCADRACRGGIVNAHEAAPRLFLNGHFRNDGNPHASAHHAQKAAELAALKNNLRVQTGPIARRNGCIAEAVAIAQEQKGLGAQVFQRKRAARG